MLFHIRKYVLDPKCIMYFLCKNIQGKICMLSLHELNNPSDSENVI